MESYGHEYFEAVTTRHLSTTTPTGPLVLGGGGGEGPVRGTSGGSGRSDYEEGVVWQGSQTCPALSRLMKSSTGDRWDGSRVNPRMGSDPSSSLCAPSRTSFSFDVGNESSTSDATSSSTTTRARALAPSARRNLSSSTSSSAPSSSHPAFEVFPQIVKKATSQVDENLKQKSTSLSRTNSANRLSLGNGHGHASSTSAIPKPRRHSPMHGTRSKDRVISDGGAPTVGSGREHRVGGDVKGKGRLHDEHIPSRDSSSTRVGETGLVEDGEAEGGRRATSKGVGREVKRRRDMPPPALPPERILAVQPPPTARPSMTKVTAEDTHEQTPVLLPGKPPFTTRPPVQHTYPQPSQLQPRQPQSGHAIAAANAQRRAFESRRPLHAGSHTTHSTRANHAPPGTQAPVPPSAAPVPAEITAPLPGPIPTSYASSSSKAGHPPPRPSQAILLAPQPAAPPLSSQAPRPSQASHQPPALGMRRANTFSSSGSQKTYTPFEFASQKPARTSSSSGQGSKTSFGGSTAQGHKPTYAAPMGLPTKQKPFRPPLKLRTKSTFELLEGYDFQTGEPVKMAASASKENTNEPSVASGSAGKKALVAGSAASTSVLNPSFAPASRAQVFSRSVSANGPATPHPAGSLSASTSSTSSLTLSSGGRTPPLTTDDTSPPERSRRGGAAGSPVTPVARGTAASSAFADNMTAALKLATRNGDDEVLLLSDRSDESFGDFGWDDGELAEAGRMFD